MAMTMNKRAVFLCCLVVGVVVMLSGCGVSSVAGSSVAGSSVAGSSVAGSSAKGDSGPDSVRVAIDGPILAQPPTQPVVTLAVATLTRQLYATILALPDLPAERACTDELGPHYTLTFRQGAASLVTVQANRDGCRPVTIAGHMPERKGTTAFWRLLDQAIYMATPPANPNRLAIEYTPQAGQAPQSALIISAATAKRLYDAILALPLDASGQECLVDHTPTYQLVFFAPNQAIPASADDSCQSVSLQGAYQSRGGTYALNDRFKQTLQSVLAEATLTPARPDQLSLTVEKYRATSRQVNISDAQLRMSLYDKVFSLKSAMPQQGCPPEADKIAGTGMFATFRFSQWSLPLLQVEVYEGSCTYAQLTSTGQWLQGNQGFWSLIQQTLGS